MRRRDVLETWWVGREWGTTISKRARRKVLQILLSPSVQYKAPINSGGILNFVSETTGLGKQKVQSIQTSLETENYYLQCYLNCTCHNKMDSIFPSRLKPATGILMNSFLCLQPIYIF